MDIKIRLWRLQHNCSDAANRKKKKKKVVVGGGLCKDGYSANGIFKVPI